MEKRITEVVTSIREITEEVVTSIREITEEVVTSIREITEEVTTYQSVICNKCGKEKERKLNSDRFEDYEDDLWNAKYQSFGCSFGYGSKFDTERWAFDLCEDCLIEFIKTFEHVPDGFKEDRSYYIIKDEEEHQKIFEHWKQTGEWNELNYKTYEELIDFSCIFRKSYINEIIKKNFPDKPLII